MAAAQDDVRERTHRALREAGEGARRAQERAVEVRTPIVGERIVCVCV